MAQWVKAFTTKPDCLNLIPEAHLVKMEKQLLEVGPYPLDVHHGGPLWLHMELDYTL